MFNQSLLSVGNPEGKGASVAIGGQGLIWLLVGAHLTKMLYLYFAHLIRKGQFYCCASSQNPPESLTSGIWRDPAAPVFWNSSLEQICFARLHKILVLGYNSLKMCIVKEKNMFCCSLLFLL